MMNADGVEALRRGHARNTAYAEALAAGDRIKAGGWEFKVRILHERFDGSPVSTGSHVQDDLYELSMMDSGRMEYRVGDELVEIDVSRGDWVMIPSGRRHCRSCANPPALIFGYLVEVKAPAAGCWSKARLDREIEKAGFHFSGSPGLSALHAVIVEEADAELPLRAERLSLLVRELLVCFLRESLPSLFDARSEGGASAASLDLMRAFIEENIARDIGLAEIAACCGLGSRHANRIFRKGCGVSLGRYVSQRRMELARRRLEEGGGQIKDIAIDLGYTDVSYFDRVFKRTFGMTPKECRAGMGGGAP